MSLSSLLAGILAGLTSLTPALTPTAQNVRLYIRCCLLYYGESNYISQGLSILGTLSAPVLGLFLTNNASP
jgi:hypothetical protein